jgi:uncharacterized protein (DUF2062 family)
MTNGFLQRRLLNPIMASLRQGITPEKIALSIALGVTLGVTPVLGSTSILCLLTAVVWRLNLPAIQLVNYLAYPLQFALLIPFIRMGEWIFAVEPAKLSVARIVDLIRTDVWATIGILWTTAMHALVVWFALGSLASLLLYLLLAPALSRLATSARTEAP